MAPSIGTTLEYTPVDEIQAIADGLKATFSTGKTRDIKFRINQIKQVGFMMQDHEAEWTAALAHDLGRPATETFLAEVNLLYADCKELVSKLPKWSKPETADTDLTWFALRPKIYKEPRGTVLVISPFNYPLTLALVPLMGALAGGNTVLLKPSEQTQAVSALMSRLIPQYLDPSVVRVVQGAKDQMVRLLDIPWDYIFFTGSGTVGKIVAEAAAKHLCPTTLELGGKSPAVVLDDADVKLAARRIMWGKHLNAAQTCIAPDYVLVPRKLQAQFIEGCRDAVRKFYPDGKAPADGQTFCKMVTPAAYGRLTKALAETKGEVVVGVDPNEKSQKIDLTVVANVSLDDPLMQQELFGPVLPIVTCDTPEDAVRIINSRDVPLALYVFTPSSKKKDFIFTRTRSGGFVQNDTLMHFAIPGLPFGGHGPSGYGNYHGKRTFDTFVHERAFVDVPGFMEPALDLRYPPYTPGRLKWYRRLLGHSLRMSRPTNVRRGQRGFLAALLARAGKLRWLIVAVAAVMALRARVV